MLFLVVLVAQCLGAIYYGWWAVLLWFVLLGPVLLLTVTLHELGHALAARYVSNGNGVGHSQRACKQAACMHARGL